jgi:spermidine/putrescine-binding protein
VAFVSGQYAQALNDAGLLAPIDPAKVPNLANLYPEATQAGLRPRQRRSRCLTPGGPLASAIAAI